MSLVHGYGHPLDLDANLYFYESVVKRPTPDGAYSCLLYTSDAADE